MKLFFPRGIAFLVTLALMLSMVSGVSAQSAGTELNNEVLAVSPAEEETSTEETLPEDSPAEEPPAEDDPTDEDDAEEGEPQEEEPPVLVTVGEFSEGMVRVTDGTRWGYAAPNGTVLIPVQFDAVEPFALGVAKVTVEGKIGLLHWNGEFLFRPEYEELSSVGYGLYLGRRGEVWDLLSTATVSTEQGAVHGLYSDLAAARVTEGVNGQLILQEENGETLRILLRNLPQWLKSKKVSGWQFPLHTSGRASFADVSGQDWYDRWVNLAYSTGMMEGVGRQQFVPDDELSVAETLRLAACLESRAIQDDFHLQGVSGSLWYSSSVTYCEAVGIISYGEYEKDDFERPVTRAEMARIFSRTTAVRGMEIINDLDRVRSSVPDVKEDDFAAEAIYGLYAKGVFTGRDSAYSYCPEESLTRAEAATMIARIARPEHRITLW